MKTLLKWMPLTILLLTIAGIVLGFYFGYHNISYGLMGLIILASSIWASVIKVKSVDYYHAYQRRHSRSISDIDRYSR